jgi:ADP-heptose:LPS heptosyltransferase
VTSAKEKIGFLTDYSNSYKWQVRISNKYYTSLIDSNREVFEFYKNRIFFENILQTSIDLTKPEIIIVNEINFNVPNNNYVVFFVGGKSKYKRWNISNFVKVAEYIVSTYDYNIILIGTGKETKLNREFNKEIKYQEKVIDMTGETSLIESINLLDKAKLLISNDSGVVHAATSVNTKAIVIFNGTHFGRFLPYPSRSYAKISTIFPEAISQTFSEKSFLYKKYKYRSLLNINSILPEKIIEKVKEIV